MKGEEFCEFTKKTVLKKTSLLCKYNTFIHNDIIRTQIYRAISCALYTAVKSVQMTILHSFVCTCVACKAPGIAHYFDFKAFAAFCSAVVFFFLGGDYYSNA